MPRSDRVVPLVKSVSNPRLHLLLERRPHHQPDGDQVEEQHCRLANSVSFISFSPRQKSSAQQRNTHYELCHQVEICPKSGARTEETLRWKQAWHDWSVAPYRRCMINS